jgi:hypothetical protein
MATRIKIAGLNLLSGSQRHFLQSKQSLFLFCLAVPVLLTQRAPESSGNDQPSKAIMDHSQRLTKQDLFSPAFGIIQSLVSGACTIQVLDNRIPSK